MNPARSSDSRTTLPDGCATLDAPSHWRVVDVISDLHLKVSDTATFAAWQHYMAHTPADAVFILGDLFEVWVGDDVLNQPTGQNPSFEAQCQQVLASAAVRLSLYFMHGNRDFLLGKDFAQGALMALLADPTVLTFDAQRWLLTHGDALCLDDVDYQRFRAIVRHPAWQDDFLTRPLPERQRFARELRAQSESLKATSSTFADVDKAAARAWLHAASASVLIHGHTHRPGQERLQPLCEPPLQRLVLSDWDASAQPPRLQALRLNTGCAPTRITLPSGL